MTRVPLLEYGNMVEYLYDGLASGDVREESPGFVSELFPGSFVIK